MVRWAKMAPEAPVIPTMIFLGFWAGMLLDSIGGGGVAGPLRGIVVLFRIMSRNGVSTVKNGFSRRAIGLGLVGLVVFSGVSGCTATYANYPAIGGDAAVNDPNSAPMPEVVEKSLVRVLEKYPSETACVINFPQGLEFGRAVAIRDAIADERVELASLSVSGLPTYHVQRVWVRGNRSRVEILVPTDSSGESYDLVTVRLAARGFANWRVTDVRRWSVDDVVVPPLYGWPGVTGE